MEQSHKHKMKPLPMLRGLRESSGLSQRALAKISGVAHDTISQIELGERLARSSTAQKLSAALDTSPFILASSIEELASFTEQELYERIEEELADDDAIWKAMNVLRTHLIEFGFLLEAEWQPRKQAASYDSLLEDIALAHRRLSSSQDLPRSADELVETAESALLLARTSAQLLQLITGSLETSDYNRVLSGPTLGKLGRPLTDAWLEGSAATKEFLNVVDKATRPLGELALEGESNSEGGDQAGVGTEK